MWGGGGLNSIDFDIQLILVMISYAFLQIEAEDGAVGIPLPVGPLDLGLDEEMPPPSQNTVAGQRYISQINSSASAMLARMFEGANMQNSTFNIHINLGKL